MARTPIDVYRALTQTRLGDDIQEEVRQFVGRFSSYAFESKSLSIHLSHFIGLISRLVAYLDSRFVVGRADLTIAIDMLDQVSSTTKWWIIDRKEPALVLRPRIREPREFMKSVTDITLDISTLNRVNAAEEKLKRFLDEQGVAESRLRNELCDSLSSAWKLLSALICRNEGRSSTNEADFERAYDVIRILLFYISIEDFRALVASRRIGASSKLLNAAVVAFSPGFERQISSSMAAHLEEQHGSFLTQLTPSSPAASRSILTNSLRLLAQLQSVGKEKKRIEEEDYEMFTLDSIKQLESVGFSPDSFNNEESVVRLFKQLKPSEGLNEHISLLTRRIEGYVIDAAGNREFLLQNSRLVPRVISLLLLISAGTKITPGQLNDSDIMRGLVLVDHLVNG
ncbi:MAG: hypothetical protein ACFFD3_09045 [Candidatus Thorarchaeota archaeon]